MLTALNIKNIALIDELTVQFENGMNVLTGETGAGKSIIVDALNLALGERADKELISAGADTASVDAVFDIGATHFSELDEIGATVDDGMLIFSREINQSGKSICRLNGKLTTLNVLKSVSDKLVDIHGQHEHQSLFNEKNHIRMLDSFGEKEIAPLAAEVRAAYHAYQDTLKQIHKLSYEGDRERRLDILKYQINEIENAELKDNEEETLLAERELQMNSEHVSEALNRGYAGLLGDEGGALNMIKDAMNALGHIAPLSEKYNALVQKLSDGYYVLEECGYDIKHMLDSTYFDAQRQEEIEERLSLFASLKKKYGGSIEAVKRFLEYAAEEKEQIENSTQLLEHLYSVIETQKADLIEKQNRLSGARKAAAKMFEREMIQQLSELGFHSCGFQVMFLNEDEQRLSASGRDEVEFYISLNRGQPVKPLKKVASGGEVSRIMLALKNIQAGLDDIDCCVFDEVDTGISGLTAQVVAKKMAAIAKTRQVICVTHLAQIAVMADRHFMIEKVEDSASTKTRVHVLDLKGKISEVARLSGGDISEVSLLHAADMLTKAQLSKE